MQRRQKQTTQQTWEVNYVKAKQRKGMDDGIKALRKWDADDYVPALSGSASYNTPKADRNLLPKCCGCYLKATVSL